MARAGLGDGWRCVFANDFDPKKAASYRVNWGASELHVGDVGGVTTDQLLGEADLAWASFPCQDLSLAGNGAGLKGDRSGSFWLFWRLIQKLGQEARAPKMIVLENVCGLLTSHGGEDFTSLCKAIADEGYWLGALIVDAALFVPQSRPRLFVIAIRQDLPVRGGVQSSEPVAAWHPSRLRDAFNRLDVATRAHWLWFNPPEPPRRNTAFADLIEDEPTGVNWHDAGETACLLAMMSPINRAKVDSASMFGERMIGAIYKRTRMENGVKKQRAEVRFDEIAGCLRTPGGGSSRQTIIVVESDRVRTRLLSARETARLMGLADNYRLPRNYNEAYHLTGDGVAVPVVRFLSEQILKTGLAPDPFNEVQLAAE